MNHGQPVTAGTAVSYPLRQIYFYLTKGCNLRCRHCWIAPKYQSGDTAYPSLDPDLFCSIVEQGKALGLRSVKLTGGEPLLHPEIHRIIEHVRTEELRLVVETNGILCTREIARHIKECRKPFVSVSLDGARAETHDYIRGVAGSYEAALEGIRNLSEEDLRPQIIMSLMKSNKEEVEGVVRLAETLGAGSVKFNIVQPTERGVRLHEAGDAMTVAELIELGRHVERELSKRTTLRLFYSYPHAFKPLSLVLGGKNADRDTCGIFGIMGVLSDGSYALCGIGENVRELTFGHGRDDSLAEVWRNATVLKEIREGMPQKLEGVCGNCLMQGVCLGSCVAQNYYRTRNLLSPFWFCKEAEEKGLFPESRLRGARNG